MVGDLKVGGLGLTEALDLHVGGVVGADGHGGVDDVGDLEHDVADLGGQLGLLGLQLGQPVGVGLHLGLGGLGLGQLAGVLFGLAHQHAHLLGQGVALGPQVVGLVHRGAVLLVQRQHLVHQGQLGVLKLLLDVLLDGFGILPDKFHIQHR